MVYTDNTTGELVDYSTPAGKLLHPLEDYLEKHDRRG
jgi:hypothetical protein